MSDLEEKTILTPSGMVLASRIGHKIMDVQSMPDGTEAIYDNEDNVIETALVFDSEGKTIHWHRPQGRSGGFLPDSRDLWDVLWEARGDLGGVAHTHPWEGPSGPSHTDITTFAAVEAGLGRRLIWLVVTFTDITQVEWVGPGRLDYRLSSSTLGVEGIEQLRNESKKEESP